MSHFILGLIIFTGEKGPSLQHIFGNDIYIVFLLISAAVTFVIGINLWQDWKNGYFWKKPR